MIEDLDPNTAKQALTGLYRENASLRDLISSTVERILGQIDWRDISEGLFVAIESIDVRDVWDNTGGDEFGYTDPLDAAGDLVEEEILPFREEMNRYLKHERGDLARHYCCGILHGLYRFAQESKSEVNEYASDSLSYHFDAVLGEWRKGESDDRRKEEMARFLRRHCSQWAK